MECGGAASEPARRRGILPAGSPGKARLFWGFLAFDANLG